MADASRKLEIIIESDDRTKGSVNVLKTSLAGLGKFATGALTVGLTAAAAGAAGLAAGLTLAVKEAMEAQEIQAQLNAVLESTGGIAGVTAEQVNQLAESLSKVTRYEDDTIVQGQNMLLTFTQIGKEVFPDATQAMLDMSTALGQDVTASAMQLGKALNDPVQGVTALRRVGVQLTDEQEAQIKAFVEAGNVMAAQKIILQELQREFGGSAQAAGNTFAGQLDRLRNTLLNVAETVGAAFLPTLQMLADRLIAFVQSDQFQQWVETISTWLRDELPKAIQTAGEFWNNTLRPAIESLIPVVEKLIPVFVKLAEFLGVILPPAITLFVGGWKLIFDAVNFILAPFQRALEAIDLLKNKFIEFWNSIKQIPWVQLGLDIIQGIVNGIKNGASMLLEAAKQAALNAYNAVKAALGISSPSKVFKDLGEMIPKGLAQGIAGSSSAATMAVGGMTRAMVPAAAGAAAGGGTVIYNISIPYNPTISTASRAELEAGLVPLIDRAMRVVERRK